MEEQPTPPPTDDASLLKPKPKRAKTEAQMAVWKKAQETRLANAKLKKDALAKAKQDIEDKKKSKPTTDESVIAKPPLAKKEPKIIYKDESDSEPEIVVVKKKKKKIIYQEEESDDEVQPTRKVHKNIPSPMPIPIKVPVIRFF